MIIAFDFDHTLFCTEKFKPAVSELFKDFGVKNGEWQKDYLLFRKRGFLWSPFVQYERMKERFVLPHSIQAFTREYDKRFSNLEPYLHDNAQTLIRDLAKKHYVYVVSYGSTAYQRKKIRATGIDKYLSGIVITHSTKTEALVKLMDKHKNERVVFLDNLGEHLIDVKQQRPEVFTVQTRPTCCMKTKDIEPIEHIDAYVTNLQQFRKIVQRPASALVPNYQSSRWGNEKCVLFAENLLERGKVIAIPTETSYGIAVLATDSAAIRRVYQIKGRGASKKLPVIAHDVQEIQKFCALASAQKKIVQKYQDEAVSFRLKKRKGMLEALNADTTVVIRKASHPCLRKLTKIARAPFTITSLNKSGKPPIFGFSAYMKQFANQEQQIDAFFDYGTLRKEPPSTILDLTVEPPTILRQGKIKIPDAA